MEPIARRHGLEIEWKAFELRPPGTDVTPKPESYLKKAWEGVHRLNRMLDMPLMKRNSHPNLESRLALEGQKYAVEQGGGDGYTREVFQAMFYADKDIADLGVLAASAAAAGLDPEAFRESVGSRKYTAAVEEDEALAARWGITAIPCFVVGDRGLLGVQTSDALEELITGVAGGTPNEGATDKPPSGK